MTKLTVVITALMLALGTSAFAKGHTSPQAADGAGANANVNDNGINAATNNPDDGPTGGKANKGEAANDARGDVAPEE